MIEESVSRATDALVALIESLNQCKRDALRPGALGKSVFFNCAGNPIECDPAEQLIKALSDWDVMSDNVHGSVPRYPALVESDSKLIGSLIQLNESKMLFKDATAAIQGKDDKERQKIVRGIFRGQKIGTAHTLQCWREIKLFLGATVNTAGFSTAKQSFSSKLLSREETIRKLSNRDADDIIRELHKVSGESVRWVVPVAQHTRLNLSFHDEEGNRRNVTYIASMPVIIEKGAWPKKLKFNPPKPETKERIRPAAKIESIIPLIFREGAYLAVS